MQGPLTTIDRVVSHCKIDTQKYRLLRRSKDAKDYYYVDRLWQLTTGRLVVILNYVGADDKDQVLLLFSSRKAKLLRERKFDSLVMGSGLVDDQLFYFMPRRGEWSTIDTLTLRPGRGQFKCVNREPYLMTSSFTSDGKMVCVQERPKNTEKECRLSFFSYEKGKGVELQHQTDYQVYSTNFEVMLLNNSNRAAICVQDQTTWLIVDPKEKTEVRHHLTKTQCKNLTEGKFYVKQVVELANSQLMLWTVSLTNGKHNLVLYNESDRTQPLQLMTTELTGPYHNIIELGQWVYFFEQDKPTVKNQPSEVTIRVLNKATGKEFYSEKQIVGHGVAYTRVCGKQAYLMQEWRGTEQQPNIVGAFSNRIQTDALPEAGKEYVEGTYLMHDWMLRVHLLKELSNGKMQTQLIKHVLQAFEE